MNELPKRREIPGVKSAELLQISKKCEPPCIADQVPVVWDYGKDLLKMIKVDMKADDVLKLPQRSAHWAVANPTSEEEDEYGFIIEWHYIDCDVVLHWRDGCYRVKEVRQHD